MRFVTLQLSINGGFDIIKKKVCTGREDKLSKKNKKEKKPAGILYRVIMTLLIIIMAVCAYNIGKTLYGYWQARNTYNKVSEVARDTDKFTGDIDFDALAKENSDIEAWLYLKDSIIDYPVVKGTDNSTYLTHLFDKSWGVNGTLFVDYRNQNNFAGFNTIIYGHHMKDGSMFGSFKKFKDQSYYDSHKQFELITPTGKYHLQVISFYTTPSDSVTYKYIFNNENEKETFLSMTMNKSEVKAAYTATTSDKLVTLSTCAYEYDNARYVIVGKLVPWTAKEIKAAKK